MQPLSSPLIPSSRYSDRPYIAIWEVTRACDLACVHCRAKAESNPYPGELTTRQALNLIRQVAQWQVPLFVMTGGDPLKRKDLSLLVKECAKHKMNFALAPSVTPLLTKKRLIELRDAGVHRISLSLDGANAVTHDNFRGIEGTFARILEAAQTIRELGIHLQINTTVGRHNRHQIWEIAQLLRLFSINLWSVFFLVPTGRAQKEQALNASETEKVLHQLYAILDQGWFDVKTTEAHHFRRVILQHYGITPDELPRAIEQRADPVLMRTSRGVGDGRGFVFISHIGDICPSGFLPLSAGNVKKQSLSKTYQESPLFQKLRDADCLNGKCGQCEYRYLCGGSRARAYSLTGDVMGADPYCAYQPKAMADAL
ncbi:MAG TPA: TIGR04053 family radical SAM/SPASM domain-containing protein [bacterium]|jgi:radical SAM protein|nr:TIGR04053 family radical SAM/SPASM domain-containing protein [bacterium]